MENFYAFRLRFQPYYNFKAFLILFFLNDDEPSKFSTTAYCNSVSCNIRIDRKTLNMMFPM